MWERNYVHSIFMLFKKVKDTVVCGNSLGKTLIFFKVINLDDDEEK